MSKERVVIIGAGMAGSKFANDLLEKNSAKYDITLIGEEAQVGYNRIMLSSLLANDITNEDMPLVDVSMMQSQGVHIIANDPAAEIDRDLKSVILESGKAISYDKLILATGSRARMLPIQGASASNVIGFRTWKDVDVMIDMKTPQPVCVIGGGLLGLEAAVGLAKRGHDVTVFHIAGWLLDRQLDEESASLLLKRLKDMGVNFRLGESPSSFLQSQDGKVSTIIRQNGETLNTSLIVMAAGIIPETELAKNTGLEVNRAILVDQHMKTSDSNVFAIGECCEFEEQMFGLVAPIWTQIKVLIDVLDGKGASFVIEPTPTKLKVSGVNLFSVGKIQPDEEDTCIFFKDIDANHYRKLVVNDGLLVGAILYGNVADGSWYFQLIQNKTNISEMLDLLVFGEAYCLPQTA